MDRAVGIDLGARVIWAVAAEAGRVVDGRAFLAGELDELAAWCGDAVVAVDAPAGPSESLHVDDQTLARKFRPARCAEVALGRAGHWVPWVTATPPFQPWMEVGFAVYAALAGRATLEVYPHAVFAELLGGRPPPKSTMAGRRARLSVLDLPPGGDLWTHDGIDAAAACLVATQHLEGRARSVECGDHIGGSVMWLPGREGS